MRGRASWARATCRLGHRPSPLLLHPFATPLYPLPLLLHPLPLPQPPPSLPSLAARYLQARTHLLCGRWGDASRELQALLPLLPQLRASMHALGLSGEALLAQTALAMLRNPKDEKEALLRLLRARGAERTAELRPYAADALLCLERAQEALQLAPEEADDGGGGGAAAGGAAAAAAAETAEATARAAAAQREVRRRSNRACLLLCAHNEAGALREWEACATLDPRSAAVAFNIALLLWKLGERRRACEHWLCFQRWPLGLPASEYERRCADVLPKPREHGAESHVSGELSKAASAAMDRMVLSHWAKLRHQAQLEQHWNR